MNIQFFIPDSFSYNYLPFLLYRESLIYIIKNHYNKINIQCVNNINILINNENIVIIMNINTITKDILKKIDMYKSKKVLINTEYIHNMNVKDILNFIDGKKNYSLLDYNVLNIEYYINHSNINYFFIPLCYNDYLISYYNNQVIKKKNFNDKDIDIFFFGTINSKRFKILDILKNKYKVVIYSGKSGINENKELCNLIERSKFVINILYYDNNLIFDYYRNALILVSNSVLINENYKNRNYELEDGLMDLENNMINVEYDDLISSIDKYMKMNEYEYNKIIKNQIESFKKYKMDEKVIRFFDTFN